MLVAQYQNLLISSSCISSPDISSSVLVALYQQLLTISYAILAPKNYPSNVGRTVCTLKTRICVFPNKVFNSSTEFVARRHIEFSKITTWNTTGSCSTLTSNIIRQVVCGSSFLWQAYDRIWPAFIFLWLKQNDDFINY